jgi:hypothetical protein
MRKRIGKLMYRGTRTCIWLARENRQIERLRDLLQSTYHSGHHDWCRRLVAGVVVFPAREQSWGGFVDP